MTRNRFCLLIALTAAISILFAGCGGGGEGTPAQSSGVGTYAPTLVWDPPKNFADGVSIDPRRDLDHYEVFLRTDPNFNDTDLPVVQVAAISDVGSPGGISDSSNPAGWNPNGRKPTTEISLDRLLPHTQPGKRYYVSIKAVGVEGLKSGFMPPVEWDLS
jgi:hypothetical protein